MRSSSKKIDLVQLTSLLQQQGAVVLLESQSPVHPAAKKSYLAALPEKEIWVYGDRLFSAEGEGPVAKSSGDPWEGLRNFHKETDGWLFGYLGYDLKNHLEKLNSDNPDRVQAPDLYMMNPGLLIEITPKGWSVLKGELPEQYARNRTPKSVSFEIGDVKPEISERDYRRMILDAKQHIGEGDYYEINLTHQMKGQFSGSPLSLYEAMKQEGPVPFGAYISFGDRESRWNVCSASPERFIAKEGSRVFSQPIKGTIHRGTSREEDKKLKEWLSGSEKNRAENLMIVDLVRNDLGRIARKGSVSVPSLFEIQSFDTVHQMVSTVEAQAGDYHPVEIIQACFPMGSMTGAPKISAMRSIETLENYRRGIYSGAIGYLAPGGDFDFNVVIRTAIIKGDDLFYSVGGAITSDSDPKSEWQETLTKAKALTAARENRIQAV